jgi:hypothetical protein
LLLLQRGAVYGVGGYSGRITFPYKAAVHGAHQRVRRFQGVEVIQLLVCVGGIVTYYRSGASGAVVAYVADISYVVAILDGGIAYVSSGNTADIAVF